MLRSKTAKTAVCVRSEGQGPFTIEYSLIVSGITIAIVTAAGVISSTLSHGF